MHGDVRTGPVVTTLEILLSSVWISAVLHRQLQVYNVKNYG